MVNKRVINVGIDLGTSRSVIACDNGVRTYLPSVVGYPKDAVARKLFGKDIVFGDEALKHRMSLEMHRPFDKGMLKIAQDLDENSPEYKRAIEAARALLKRLIEIALEADPGGDGNVLVRGVLGAPALASRKNKKAMLEIARGILDDVMYVSEPFAVAYGLGLLTNAFIVDIGAGTVDLCRMHGTMPTDDDQITTMKAGDYVDQVFYELLTKKYTDANFTVNMVKKFKEENSNISQRGDSIYIELPVKGKPVKHDVTAELRLACKAIVPDIVEGIRKLIASFDPEFQMHLKENVILAGGGSQIVGLKREIEEFMIEKLGYGKVTTVEEPLYAGANGALMLCRDMPDEYWHELKDRAK
ncbi:MamK family actin-like protein [Candidatus Magnetominusculus dajiuhuensis]|uniref:MamK family actin-like protein n=1 Tax=Candidatus Magnetominusculus dajiuhuensis TaxID=3137712 RepID=UPI003B42812A